MVGIISRYNAYLTLFDIIQFRLFASLTSVSEAIFLFLVGRIGGEVGSQG